MPYAYPPPLPQYKYLKRRGKTHAEVAIATITQKGTENGNVPSLVHNFCAVVPSFYDAPNVGFSKCLHLYAKDETELEDLKKRVEQEFLRIQLVFQNTL